MTAVNVTNNQIFTYVSATAYLTGKTWYGADINKKNS